MTINFDFLFRNIVRKDSMWDMIVFRKIQVRNEYLQLADKIFLVNLSATAK